MKILAIDPSINYCGVAVYNNKKLIHYDLVQPKTKSDDYIEKSKSVFAQVSDVNVDKFILEIPEHWGTSGYLARESGSIYKVTFLCGMICSLPNVVTVTPAGWKGQIPKHVMRNRFIKNFPELDVEEMNHNILDAIGIGRWYIYGKI